MLTEKPVNDHFRLGLMFAVGSAITFGMSGPFAKSLMSAGWSPTAAVTARLVGGALVMAIFATAVKPDWFREAAQHIKTIVAYGLVPIAGAQLCYYNAVSHLSVAVALLLEYTAPIIVVGWIWATTRTRPSRRTMAGVALALAGIMGVLNIFDGAHINAVGVGWAMASAVCAACYFVMSDTSRGHLSDSNSGGTPLHPITLAAGGLIVGAAAVTVLGMSGLMPLTFTAQPVVIAGFTTSWIVPVIVLGVVSTAIAYTLGITGVAFLRPGFASLVGLAEVLFAVLWAWLLVAEAMTPVQAIGAAVVLAGLALARQGDKVAAATWPETGHIDELTTVKSR